MRDRNTRDFQQSPDQSRSNNFFPASIRRYVRVFRVFSKGKRFDMSGQRNRERTIERNTISREEKVIWPLYFKKIRPLSFLTLLRLRSRSS